MSEQGPLQSDAEKWRQLAVAWKTYCDGGAGELDWDCESRDLMDSSLTGDYAFPYLDAAPSPTADKPCQTEVPDV